MLILDILASHGIPEVYRWKCSSFVQMLFARWWGEVFPVLLTVSLP